MITEQDLRRYAEKLSGELNYILAYEGKKLVYQLYDIGPTSPLTVVEFKQVSKTNIQTKKETVKVEGIEGILIRISKNLRNEISYRLFTQEHLRIYEKDILYIIKPAEKRFWTESAALNDVSSIIDEHMRTYEVKYK